MPSCTKVATRFGRLVDLLEPDPATIALDDMAWHGARINRWAGGTMLPVSVARHSIWVADHVSPKARPWALFHDMAHEPYIGDIVAPVVEALDAFVSLGARRRDLVSNAVDLMKWRFDRVVREAFDVPWSNEIADEVDCADLDIRATEARDFLFDPPANLVLKAVSTDLKRSIRTPEQDEADWLAYVRHVCPHITIPSILEHTL